MTRNNKPDRGRSSDELWADFDRADREAGVEIDVTAELPENRDELVRMVGTYLYSKFDCQVVLDNDGDYVVQHMGQKVWISVRPDAPVVMIFARVAHDVYSRRSTEVELGILNRRHIGNKWSLTERNIWQEISMVALPFVPFQFSMTLDTFLEAMTSTCDDLAYRTGAKVA